MEKTTIAPNEFDSIDDESAPTQAFSGSKDSGDVMASSNRGTIYDFNNAPDRVKAPPRIDLNGKTVTIKSATMELPPLESSWEWTKDRTKEFKFVLFRVVYDGPGISGQQEYFAGVRTFKRIENNVAKYSHPSIPRDRNSQASYLMGLFADYRKKDINEVTIKEFLSFLNSSPKALIKAATVMNPKTKENVTKNLIEKFVD
jgi:hypothetical protein